MLFQNRCFSNSFFNTGPIRPLTNNPMVLQSLENKL